MLPPESPAAFSGISNGTKPGYSRQRNCSLDDNEYRQIFELICILCKKTGLQSFPSKVINEITKSALDQCDFKIGSTKYLDDIVKITCLILKEGDEYRYIHKTVQEYYTASYIQKKPESWANTFYERILTNKVESTWQQEITFLSEIDSYRYKKYYLLPSILTFLQIPESELDNGKVKIISIDQLKELIGLFEFYFQDDELLMISSQQEHRFILMDIDIFHFLKKFDFSKMAKAMKNAGLCHDVDAEKEKEIQSLSIIKNDPANKIIFCRIFDGIKAGLFPEINDSFDKEFKRVYELAKEIHISTKEEENSSILEGLT